MWDEKPSQCWVGVAGILWQRGLWRWLLKNIQALSHASQMTRHYSNSNMGLCWCSSYDESLVVGWSGTDGEVDWRWTTSQTSRSERDNWLGEIRNSWEKSFCCNVLELKKIKLRNPPIINIHLRQINLLWLKKYIFGNKWGILILKLNNSHFGLKVSNLQYLDKKGFLFRISTCLFWDYGS